VTSYAASIALFWRTGRFADGEAIEFLVVNPRMLFLYLMQTEKVFCGAILFVVACGCVLLSWSSLRASPRVSHPAIVAVALVAAMNLGLLLVSLNAQPQELENRDFWRMHPTIEFELRSRTSGVISLCADYVLPRESEFTGELSDFDLGAPRDSVNIPASIVKRPATCVILVAIESMRSDVLGRTHQNRPITPVLNRLAKEGRSFLNAYAQSTHSDYADPCLVSSLYPLRSDRHHYYSRSDPWPKLMLYDVLAPLGYRSAIFSSQNESWGRMDAFLESRHLDEFFDSRCSQDESYVAPTDLGFSQFVGEAKAAGKLDDAVTIAKACTWIRQQVSSKTPFFIYLNLQSSHFPYRCPARDHVFQPCDFDFAASFAGYPHDKIETVRNAYYNSLHYIDGQLEKLILLLTELGIRDQTLLVLAGDNGEAFYENGYPTHAGPAYEPAIHVACILNCPHLVPAAVDDRLLQMIDLAPTILGLLGLPQEPCFQGQDVLSPAAPASERRLAFIHCEVPGAREDAVISATGWKLVHDRLTDEVRLHDLRVDPAEQRNRANSESAVTRVLSALLQRFRRQQLLYYAKQKYYSTYFAPRTPTLSGTDLQTLLRAEHESKIGNK
jgi:arylsulfatase A-like enzyme